MARHTGSSDHSAEVPEIGPDELIFKSKIGGGQFGDVFLGTCRGKTVAIKKLHAKQFEAKLLEEFRKEVAILTFVLPLLVELLCFSGFLLPFDTNCEFCSSSFFGIIGRNGRLTAALCSPATAICDIQMSFCLWVLAPPLAIWLSSRSTWPWATSTL